MTQPMRLVGYLESIEMVGGGQYKATITLPIEASSIKVIGRVLKEDGSIEMFAEVPVENTIVPGA